MQQSFREPACPVCLLLSQRRLRWLGHVRRMDTGRIPKDMLYGELREGSRRTGRPQLRFKDVCKRDLKLAAIDLNSWEATAENRLMWKATVTNGVKRAEEARTSQLADKRTRRKARAASVSAPTAHICTNCSRDCHSRVGLFSHSRRCQSTS